MYKGRLVAQIYISFAPMEKKEKELFILNNFIENFKCFPEGLIEQTESPDFIVHSNLGNIGIELAEIFQDSHVGKASKLKQRENLHRKFGEQLVKKLEEMMHKKKSFSLDISFNDHQSFTVKQISSLIDKCWPECIEFLWNESEGFARIENMGTNLPYEVNEIFILLSKQEYNPVYCNSQGGTVAILNNDHLDNTLAKHDLALAKYQKCLEYWLIIREGNYYAGRFSDRINISTPIKSNFDKVFLFRTSLGTNKIIVLK